MGRKSKVADKKPIVSDEHKVEVEDPITSFSPLIQPIDLIPRDTKNSSEEDNITTDPAPRGRPPGVLAQKSNPGGYAGDFSHKASLPNDLLAADVAKGKKRMHEDDEIQMEDLSGNRVSSSSRIRPPSSSSFLDKLLGTIVQPTPSGSSSIPKGVSVGEGEHNNNPKERTEEGLQSVPRLLEFHEKSVEAVKALWKSKSDYHTTSDRLHMVQNVHLKAAKQTYDKKVKEMKEAEKIMLDRVNEAAALSDELKVKEVELRKAAGVYSTASEALINYEIS